MKQKINVIAKKRVLEINRILRTELLNQLSSGKTTMTEFEKKTGFAHSFIFNWREGKREISKAENLIVVMKVLGKSITTSIRK